MEPQCCKRCERRKCKAGRSPEKKRGGKGRLLHRKWTLMFHYHYVVPEPVWTPSFCVCVNFTLRCWSVLPLLSFELKFCHHAHCCSVFAFFNQGLAAIVRRVLRWERLHWHHQVTQADWNVVQCYHSAWFSCRGTGISPDTCVAGVTPRAHELALVTHFCAAATLM